MDRSSSIESAIYEAQQLPSEMENVRDWEGSAETSRSALQNGLI